MRKLAVVMLLSTLAVSGCKRKELEAALAEANKKLEATQGELSAEKDKNKKLNEENQTLQQKIAELEGQIRKLNADIKVLEEQNADLARKAGATADELKKLRDEKAKRLAELQVYKDLFAKLKALIDAGTIQVEVRKGRFVVKLASSILFDSGKTDLKPEGQAALSNLAGALKSLSDREWLVAGHTDNVPIKTGRYRSNWNLSSDRAANVVISMVGDGVAGGRLTSAGRSDQEPMASNSTPGGRSLNRRVELWLPRIITDTAPAKGSLTDSEFPSS